MPSRLTDFHDPSVVVGQPGTPDPRTRHVGFWPADGVRLAGDLDCEWIAAETGIPWHVAGNMESSAALAQLVRQRTAILALLHRADLNETIRELCRSKIGGIGSAIPPLAEMIAQKEAEVSEEE